MTKALFLMTVVMIFSSTDGKGQKPVSDVTLQDTVLISDTIQYHPIRINKADNSLLPWYSSDAGKSYDHILGLVWQYWNNLPECLPGVKWYMMHRQVIVSNSNYFPKGGHDDGIGGDQVAMAMSSWRQYYAYSGDTALIKDMEYMAGYFLENGLSGSDYKWPDIVYVCNPGLDHDTQYRGDWVVDFALYKKKEDKLARKEAMKNGLGYLQPDKAGSFAYELVNLYKITGNLRYLDAAVKMANTLAKHTVPGDQQHSPLPYRVVAKTGKIFPQTDYVSSEYTSNYTGTILLFDELLALSKGNTVEYIKARNLLIDFLKNVAVKYDLYGPFFEDIPMWSNTQINALTIGRYILLNKEKWGPSWRKDARKTLDWATNTLRHDKWKKYGVVAIGEQTVYNAPGNSHTARQAAVELLYGAATGDITQKDSAIRQLNWATYMVDNDGKNCYPNNEIWLTDGYGDYVRHYLWAMAAAPELAPADRNHLLSSTSVVQFIEYATNTNNADNMEGQVEKAKNTLIEYRTFNNKSEEMIRMTIKPSCIMVNKKLISETNNWNQEGWSWKPMKIGGILTIRHQTGKRISVVGN